jgi:hypothetical protein
MEALRKWVRKVMLGLAAFLLAAFESLGQAHMTMYPYGYGYAWTESGMRVMMMEQEQQEHIARLEGQVEEEKIRLAAGRQRDEEKAVS